MLDGRAAGAAHFLTIDKGAKDARGVLTGLMTVGDLDFEAVARFLHALVNHLCGRRKVTAVLRHNAHHALALALGAGRMGRCGAAVAEAPRDVGQRFGRVGLLGSLARLKELALLPLIEVVVAMAKATRADTGADQFIHIGAGDLEELGYRVGDAPLGFFRYSLAKLFNPIGHVCDP